MAAPRVIVVTSDKYLWAMKPFSYLFNTFWSTLQPVLVIGYSFPPFSLPENFVFRQVSPVEYPAERWSNALIEVLHSIPDMYFVLLLDDYWLCRTVDHRGVASLADYMYEHPNILRIDLSNDVLHTNGDARDAKFFDYYGHYDIIEKEPDKAYRMSLQAGLWNRELMLMLLQENKTPWETEIHTSVPPEMFVLGTRQWPVRYANAIYKGSINQEELKYIPEHHRNFISQFIPREWQIKVPNVGQ